MDEKNTAEHQLTAIDRTVGENIRRRRRALHLTQMHVGRLLGVTPQQIHKYEGGLSRISAARLWLLSFVLDMPVDYFFRGA